MAFDAKVRKWGNSMGIIIPKEIAEQKGLAEGETINIEVMKRLDLRSLPKFKFKMTAQQLKDEERKGWE